MKSQIKRIQHAAGRSMIEMLGVLAIIGVLSIGGIALYRRAVNNHHANTILDDVNRFAFVIMESNRAFSTNAFIDNIEYNQTSTYNLDAFLGTGAGQFGIVVTNVSKGVCKPLVDKASVEYKVRVLPANTADSIQQLAALGTLYNSTQMDICESMNDVVLYFGDTSNQTPINDDDPIQCTSNTDCYAGGFCEYIKANLKECHSISSFGVLTAKIDEHTWVRTTEGMHWNSIQNFCEGLGMSPASREDIGCNGLEEHDYCSSNLLNAFHGNTTEDWCWLEQHPYSGSSYTVNFYSKKISSTGKSSFKMRAICH